MVAEPHTRFVRAFGVAGALACAIAVALGAYAAHLADANAQHRLGLAAVFAFGHGLALLALTPQARSRLQRIALGGLLAGMLLFCGSLALAALFGTSTVLAPFGGSLMILGWLVYAIGTAIV